jgi:hypothetical protein
MASDLLEGVEFTGASQDLLEGVQAGGEPYRPRRDMGFFESAGKSAAQATIPVVRAIDMAAAGVAGAFERIFPQLAGEQDRIFQMMQERNQRMTEAYTPAPEEQVSLPGAVVGGIASLPVEMAGGFGAQHGIERTAQVLERGGTGEQAALAGGVTGATRVGLNLLPVKVGGKIGGAVEGKLGAMLGGATTGAAVNVPGEALGVAAENLALPGAEGATLAQRARGEGLAPGMEGLGQDPLDPTNMAVSAGLSGALGAVGGATAKKAPPKKGKAPPLPPEFKPMDGGEFKAPNGATITKEQWDNASERVRQGWMKAPAPKAPEEKIPTGEATEIPMDQATATAPEPATETARRAEIKRLMDETTSDQVRAVLKKELATLDKAQKGREAQAGKAADRAELLAAAAKTDDPEVKAALLKQADQVMPPPKELPTGDAKEIEVETVEPAPEPIPAGEATEVDVETVEPDAPRETAQQKEVPSEAVPVEKAPVEKPPVEAVPEKTAPPPSEPADARPPDVAPKSSVEWTREMGRLRDEKPRPLDKLYGKAGPTPEQAKAHADAMRKWNSAYRKASAAQKAALQQEQANAPQAQPQQEGVQPERVPGDEGRQAGPGDSVQRAAPRQEGQAPAEGKKVAPGRGRQLGPKETEITAVAGAVDPNAVTVLRNKAGPVTVGKLKIPRQAVRTPEAAAQALAPMRRDTQEQFLALVTDNNDAPLAVIRHAKGGPAETSVYPQSLLSAVAQVKGGKNVWFAHNHPSGVTKPSTADASVQRGLQETLRGSGMNVRAHTIIGPGGKTSFFETAKTGLSGGFTSGEKPIKPSLRKAEVPIQETRFTGFKKGEEDTLNSPAQAKSLIERRFKKGESGIVLLDHRLTPTGVLPMTDAEMAKLRTGDTDTGVMKVLRALGDVGASAAFIKASHGGNGEFNNLSAALNALDIRVVDIFQESKQGSLQSLAEKGSLEPPSGKSFQSLDRGRLRRIAIDRAIQRDTGKEPKPLPPVQTGARLEKALKEYEAAVEREDRANAGEALAKEVERLAEQVALRNLERGLKTKPRERGADYVRQRLLEAKRRGDLGEEAADFADWFIRSNPSLVDDLAIAVRTAPEGSAAAGTYNPINRLITLFKGGDQTQTAVHEVLHHLERLMTPELQAGVRRAYLRDHAAALRAAIKANDDNRIDYLADVLVANTDSNPRVARAAAELAMEKLTSGKVPYEAYQFFNPSEYWAVNMADRAFMRYQAGDGIWGRTQQWLKEALEHIKGALGLRSQAPMLRALNDLLRTEFAAAPDGTPARRSPGMLAQKEGEFLSPNLPAKPGARGQQAPDLERRPDGAPMKAASPGGNFLVGGAARAHLERLIKIPGQRLSMGPGVVFDAEDLKIRGSVVEAVPIEMMDVLVRAKLTPKDPFHDLPMRALLPGSVVEANSIRAEDVAGTALAVDTPGLGHADSRSAHNLAQTFRSEDELDAALRKKLGSKLIDGLREQGILHYLSGAEDAPSRPHTKGRMLERSDDTSHARLYWDRLTEEEAPRALFHEIGEHFSIIRLLGDDRYRVLLGELADMNRSGDAEVRRAWETVKQRYVGASYLEEGSPQFVREVAARLVESAPDMPWVRRLLAEIRSWLYQQFGTTLGNRADATLIRGLAWSALKKAGEGELPRQDRFVYPDFMRSGEPIAEFDQAMQGEPSYGGSPPRAPPLGEEDKAELVTRKLFDRFNRVLRVQKATGITDEDKDIYLADTLYQGRVQHEGDKLQRDYIDPLGKLLKEAKQEDLTTKDADDYLMALHAPERNRVIAARNDKMPDGGSGLTDQQAADIIDSFTPAQRDYLDRVAAIVHRLNREKLQRMVESGLITPETRDTLNRQYRNYVPLKTLDEEDAAMGTGRGYELRASDITTAMGRRSKAGSPIAASIMDASRVIIRSEKARVDRTIWNFANDAAADPFMRPYDPDNPPATVMSRTIGPDGKVKDVVDTQKVLDQTISLMVDGEARRIFVDDELLREQIRKVATLNDPGAVLRAIGRGTGAIGRMLTEFNPAFTIPNAVRDAWSVGLRAPAHGIGRWKAVSGIPKAWASIVAYKRGANTPGAKSYEEFQEVGGKIGAYGIQNVADTMRRLEKVGAELGYDEQKGGLGRKGMNVLRDVAFVFSQANEVFEYATRLSAYEQARAVGNSPKRAAAIAKDITVNFNRSGEYGRVMNSLLVFANAALQGLYGTIRYAANPKVQRGMLGLVALGIASQAWNELMGGVNEETGEPNANTQNDSIMDKNLVALLPESKSGFKIPLPQEYAALYAMGRRLYRGASQGDWGREAAGVTGALIDASLPVRLPEASSLSLGAGKAIVPTLGAPFADLWTNENYFGAPIYVEQRDTTSPAPYYTLTRPQTSVLAKEVSEMLNTVTGGDAIEPGLSQRIGGPLAAPEGIEHLVGFYTGGAGQFVMQSANMAKQLAGDPNAMELNRTPIVNRFVFNEPTSYIGRRYRELEGQLEYARDRMKAGQEITNERLERALPVFEDTERELSRLRKEMRAAANAGESVDELRKQARAAQSRVIRAYNNQPLQ